MPGRETINCQEIEGAVDHFPSVLTHLSDRNLIAITRCYLRRAQEDGKSPWDDCAERAAVCRAECARRRLSPSLVTLRGYEVA